jgi:hypothetical protein
MLVQLSSIDLLLHFCMGPPWIIFQDAGASPGQVFNLCLWVVDLYGWHLELFVHARTLLHNLEGPQPAHLCLVKVIRALDCQAVPPPVLYCGIYQ